jgi:hypothetical protein
MYRSPSAFPAGGVFVPFGSLDRVGRFFVPDASVVVLFAVRMDQPILDWMSLVVVFTDTK